ncbi:MAG: mechanosensitive ion channel [Gemmatimonadetes bacterium]|uniref:Mechanosensitive ion channel n=1 Tax=Candidatus Kutchimonas denitrificans TaxID=3056748 RepID=A0AAE5CA82_9BACT|nr:mechanosensitive ion channel [Gemmatimonadota bacterium]NIR74297.1 mechanosensitive ion channel [Candidatus Kutchimonas denitrificans]NIS02552.1 mechanosensitive ion channel [Gemmatimonadota bacterium]NIT68428.1 mechanosensitive ion channel [Gemmatimonadota bacterium]NIU51880.1 mechanosensitive ion channel [Gemmatimonadota bacterium]
MILENSLEVWVRALLVALVIWLALKLLPRWLRALARRLAPKLKDETVSAAMPAEIINGILERVRGHFQIAAALYAGTSALTLPGAVHNFFRIVFIFSAAAQLAVWVIFIVEKYFERAMRARGEPSPAETMELRWVSVVVRVLVWVMAMILALDNVGVDVTALLTGLGVGGIAVALALQSVMSDIFSSLAIVVDKPFVTGDFLIIGDMLGTVEVVGLKTTRIRSLSGEQLIFTNTDLVNSRIRNYGKMAERRVVFNFGVVYQTPADKLEAVTGVVREIVESQGAVRFDRAHFKQFADSSLEFEVVYYVLSPDYNQYMNVQQAINLELFRRLEEMEVEFAYPTRTVHLASELRAAGGGEALKAS